MNLFELLDAQRTYNQVLTAYSQARADYPISLWQLEQAIVDGGPACSQVPQGGSDGRDASAPRSGRLAVYNSQRRKHDWQSGIELLILLAIVFFLFGAKRLPEVGKGIGEGIRNFKKAMSKEEKDFQETNSKDG